jgi:hypothetical protein
MRCTGGPRGTPRTDGERANARAKGGCLTHVRLLRPARSGIFLRSFRLHSGDYARETIAKTGGRLGLAGGRPRDGGLRAPPMSQTGS